MTTTCAQVPNSQTNRRRIPMWDKVITGICLVLTVVAATYFTGLTGLLAMATDPCAPDGPCVDQVGRGIAVSLLGMLAVLVIGLSCVTIAAITRTWLFVWALATLLLLPVPVAIGCNIANHAAQLGTVGRSHP
ncbi:hypothetical protein VMT65_29055 [Nocardia sp. CDC153]|uniref:hypothetical protein n=1 Tax=Nocardia sp. CDC153 TaxID=3112167 RepID=UPI002DBDFEAF|nr:hypothetical protein [Nocardia sp. CDC153]MEC3957116.1 hypothetical protein [Nocardia sp. CDC153]